MRWAAVSVVVTLLICSPLVRAPFVYEDANWLGTLTADQGVAVFQWPNRALTQLTYRLQAVHGQAAPRSYHLLNIGLHLLTGWAVYALGRQLALTPRSAWLGATIFLWHPLNVAAVAYVSARSDVLMTLCAVLAVALALSRRWWTWPLVLVACALSGAAKELGALSGLLVLWTWRPRWLLAGLAVWPLVLLVHWPEYGVYWPRLQTGWELASANVMSVWRIIGLMVVPVGLNMDPDPWFWWMPERVLGLVALLGAAGWAWSKGSPLVHWALGWLVLTLAIRIVMPTGEAIHDQHAYVAMVGTSLLMGAWIGEQSWHVVSVSRF